MSTFDIEKMRDPWGGYSKQYTVRNPITGESYGETNSHITATNLQAEHEGAEVVNLWSARLSNNLFSKGNQNGKESTA